MSLNEIPEWLTWNKFIGAFINNFRDIKNTRQKSFGAKGHQTVKLRPVVHINILPLQRRNLGELQGALRRVSQKPPCFIFLSLSDSSAVNDYSRKSEKPGNLGLREMSLYYFRMLGGAKLFFGNPKKRSFFIQTKKNTNFSS